jgi:hypothetical protein
VVASIAVAAAPRKSINFMAVPLLAVKHPARLA